MGVTATRVARLNDEIEMANKADILAVEPDSTWESEYKFEPVKLGKRFVTVTWRDIYGCTGRQSERVALSNNTDASFLLNWVRRAIKKGYREAGIDFNAR